MEGHEFVRLGQSVSTAAAEATRSRGAEPRTIDGVGYPADPSVDGCEQSRGSAADSGNVVASDLEAMTAESLLLTPVARRFSAASLSPSETRVNPRATCIVKQQDELPNC